MFSPNERAKIIALINREVVPAIGCTEPIAVALCTARAAELLDAQPEKIEVRLSANILKNAMGVGIPGTGMIGLPIAVALGALVGRSEYQLEVLRDVTPEAVGRGARYIDEKRVCISLKEDISEKLYIEVEASAGERRAVAVIAGGHTAFVYLERDGEVLLDKRTASVAEEEAGEVPLTLRRVWDFAMTAPLDELRFILETRRVNKAAAERAFAGEFGHCVGRTLRCERERQVMGIVGWLTTTRTRLCLHPACVFLVNPAATFRSFHERFRRLRINGNADHRLFLWRVLLVGVRQRRKIFCALLQYAGGGLLSRYDVAFAVHRADFFRW